MTKKHIITAIMVFALPLMVLAGSGYDYSDSIPPSQNPPGSLTPDQVPQFVILGIDDNKFEDGVIWAAEYLRNRVNPTGTGNPATYDSVPVRASFYILAVPAYNYKGLQGALIDLYHDGNELGNHTLNHFDGVDSAFTVEKWKNEMIPCQVFLTDTLKIPAVDIWGFRTPFLSYNNDGFAAMKEMGFVYDCSIEEGQDSTQDGTNFYWPYTLNDGSPGANICAADSSHEPIDSSHDGLWEMPAYYVIAPPDSECANYGIPTGLRHRLLENLKTLTGDSTWDTLSGKITGLDYNFWFDFNMTKEDYTAILNYTLDKRLAGNRAPLNFGAHSDFYSLQYISEPKGCNTTYLQRREAMEEFLDYALSKPAVRVVPACEVIKWMRSPVALDQTFAGPCTLTVSAIDSGTVSADPLNASYAKDELVTLTATPATGWVFDRWSGPDITGDSTTLVIRMYKNITAKAVFKREEAALDTSNASINQLSVATWAAYCDDSSTIVEQSLNLDSAFASFIQVPKIGDEWPWIEFVAEYNEPLTTVIGIEVEYKCDNPLIIQFVQPEFEVDLSYAHFQYVGPKSETEWHTVRAAADHFYQPDWTPLASKSTLKLNTVRNLSFIPAVGEAGDTTFVTIRKLILYYQPTPIITDIKAMKPPVFSIHGIKPDTYVLTVPQDDKYTVRFFSVNGSEVLSVKGLACTAGPNIIRLNRTPFASGVYVVRINAKTVQSVPRKLVIRK